MPQKAAFPGIFAEVNDLGSHFIKILWSGFYFALAFIIIHYLDNLITASFASWLDHPVLFSYDSIKPIAGAPSPWTLNRVALIYLSSSLICLIISSALLPVLYATYSNSHLSLFLFWLSLNGFILFYSYFFTGILGAGNYRSIFFTGYALYLSWLYMSGGTVTVLLVLAIIGFSFFSFLFTKLVFKFSYSEKLVKTKQGRSIFFLNTIVFPFIAGALLIGAITWPLAKEYQFIRLTAAAVVLFMMFIKIRTAKKPSNTFIQKGGINYRSFLFLAIAITLLTLAVKYLLSEMVSL